MEDKLFLRLLILAGGFLSLILLFLLVLSPICALVFAAAAALLFTIAWYRWPRFHGVVAFETLRARRKISDKVKALSGKEQEPRVQPFRPEYYLVHARHGRVARTLVNKEVFLIGRRESCDMVIPDQSVAREHCRIVYRKYSRTYFIEDLHSMNGTYLGVRRLEPYNQVKLLENAEISISDRVYRFVRTTPPQEVSDNQR